MREILQVRFGEIFLKGSNRPYFMRMLVERIRNAVKELGGHVWLSDSRVYVSDLTDMDEGIRKVGKVFGVHSLCRALELPKDDFNAICGQVGIIRKSAAVAAADDAETDFFHVFMPCFKKIDNFFYKILAILQNSIYILCIMVKKDVFFRDKMRNIDILWI